MPVRALRRHLRNWFPAFGRIHRTTFVRQADDKSWLKPVGADPSRAKSAAKAGLGALVLAGIFGALAALRARRRRPPSLGDRVSRIGRMKVMGKLGMAVGAAIGYVLGAKAGRECYDQITASARQAQQATGQAGHRQRPGKPRACVEQVAYRPPKPGTRSPPGGWGTGTTGATTGTTTTTTIPSVPSTSAAVTSGGEAGAATTTDAGSTTSKRSGSGERKFKSS